MEYGKSKVVYYLPLILGLCVDFLSSQVVRIPHKHRIRHKKKYDDILSDASSSEVAQNHERITLLLLAPKEMEEHQCYNVMKLDEIVPTMISAVAYVNKHWNFHHWKFDTIYEDTNCSSVKGPLAAIEFRGKAGKFPFFKINFPNLFQLSLT